MAAEEQHQVVSRSAAATYGLEYHNDDTSSSRIERMVNNPFLSDITFVVGPDKQRIYAHKLHLVTVSEYFYSMFYGNFSESKRDEIELKDEDPEIFLTMLRLIYGAKVEFDYENLRDIYQHIQMYLLPNEYCKPLINFLMDQIVDKDTAMKIFRENEHYKFEHVDEVCLSYIKNDPLYFFRKDDFTTLEQESLRKIVCLQKINCTEEQLLCALEKWELANPELDLKELRELVIGTKRSYFSHQLIFRVSTRLYRSDEYFFNPESLTITLTSRNSVSVYGIGVYLLPSDNDVSIKLSFEGTNEVYKEISSLNFIKRGTPNLEVVDLMFEEIVFVTNKPYRFRLSINNRNNYIVISGNGKAITTHKKMTFIYGESAEHAIPHMWVKFPQCGIGKNQMAQKCCQIIKKNNKHYG